ncbi:MAG: arginase [Candidatus Ozemobacteraceae bacterium]
MNIDIIGVPLDLGADRRGVDMGPSAIRYAGLKKVLDGLGIRSRDLGNIHVPIPESSNEEKHSTMKHLAAINRVNAELATLVAKSIEENHLPLVLGGDHSIAVGTILGVQSVRKNVGIIWMDAHGDFNTEKTTISGNLHGMSLAAVTGTGISEMTAFKSADTAFIHPSKVVLVGVRDLDDGEERVLMKSGVTTFSMEDIDRLGMKEIMNRSVEIASSGTCGIHLSFDMDVLDPNEAPGVGTPVHGGLTYREAHLAIEMISDSQKICSLEFVELNPILDTRNQTGTLALSLIASALGRRILRRY